MIRLLVTTGILAACTVSLAAPIFLTGSSPHQENFDGYRGTAATVPSAWTTAGDITVRNGVTSDGNAQWGVFTAGSSLYVAENGWYAWNATAVPTDYALVLRTQTSSTSSITTQVVNQTGVTLNGLTIGWNFEQYTKARGTGQVALFWSTDGTNFTSAGLSGDLLKGTSALDASAGTTPVVLTTPETALLSTTLSQSIAAGDSVYLRYVWSSTFAGNQPHFGIDNISIAATAIPEPSLLLAAGILLSGIWLRRRR